MKNSKITKSVIVGSFTGLASIPGLFYALVVRPVQSVETNAAMSETRQNVVLHNASNTGRLLFALGLLFLVVLIAFIAIGLVAQQRENGDEK